MCQINLRTIIILINSDLQRQIVRDMILFMRWLLPKIFLVFATFVSALIIGELMVQRVRPQMSYKQAVSASFACFDSDPDVTFTLQKNYDCRMKYYLGDFDVMAHMNSLGYRGKEFNKTKPPGVTRILVLGDSMTFGHGVTDEQTYPYKLEQDLKAQNRKIEVINAGYKAGNSIDSYYVYLNKHGIELQPDIIILGFFVFNDITDLTENNWDKVNSEGLPEKVSSKSIVADPSIKMLRRKNISLKYRFPYLRDSHLFILLISELERLGLIKYKQEPELKDVVYNGCVFSPDCIGKFSEEEAKTYKIITAMKKLADDHQVRFVTMLIPGDIQLYKSMAWKYSSVISPPDANPDFIQKRINANLSKVNIDVLDLYPFFLRNKDIQSLFYTNDAHLTNSGTGLVADVLSAYLLDRKFIN